MDSKTLTTVAIVVLCVLFFPIAIAIAGGVFGLMGAIIGGILGVLGGILGGIFGLIGHVFGAIFGVFGWIFGGFFHHDWPFHPAGGKLLALLIVVLIAVAISRRNRSYRQ